MLAANAQAGSKHPTGVCPALPKEKIAAKF